MDLYGLFAFDTKTNVLTTFKNIYSSGERGDLKNHCLKFQATKSKVKLPNQIQRRVGNMVFHVIIVLRKY